MIRRTVLLLAFLLAALLVASLSGPAAAIKVFINPSTQQGNHSADWVYTEGANMQDVAARLLTKLTARGFQAQRSAWEDAGVACANSNAWGANAFVALHTDAVGDGNTWYSTHGTKVFYHQDSTGWHDDRNIDLANKVAARMTVKFNAFGRGYNMGAYADYPYMTWNMYVIAPWNTSAIPAVLVEGLYHTNYDDVYSVLLKPEGRDAYAQGVFEGLCDYYGWAYGAGSITGKVTSAAGGAAIAGAIVAVNTGATATTDASGNYTISGLGPGTYTVGASALNYNTGTGSAVVTTGATTCNLSLTPTQLVPVFTDGLADMNNWAADVDSTCVSLALDSGTNHGTYSGGNSARVDAGTPCHFMYHDNGSVFAAGKYEAWFYDSSGNDASNQGIHLRARDSQSKAVAYSLYLGPNPGRGDNTLYWAGAFDGVAWTWYSTGKTRSAGWHKLGIEALPYTGVGDLKFYVDGQLAVTTNRPPNTLAYGLTRIYMGLNWNAGVTGKYDDLSLSLTTPSAPAMVSGTNVTAGAITWTWNCNAQKDGYRTRLLNSSGGTVCDLFRDMNAGVNQFVYTESNLLPNTVCSRTAVTVNGGVVGPASSAIAKCTLSAPPSTTNLTCNRAVGSTSTSPDFTFTAVGGLGPGTVQYYRYAFDQDPNHTWDYTEPKWTSGNLARTADSEGDWYLHVTGYNAANVPNGSLDLGPFNYSVPIISTPMNFVKVGWNMLSLPAEPADPDPLSVLAGIDVPNVSLQYWKNDVDGGGYQLYGETFGWTGPMVVGIPYWFLEGDEEKTVSFIGAENTSDWQVTIPAHSAAPYWTALGHPFYHPTSCAAIKFSSPSHPFPMVWEDAYIHTVVESTAAGYEPSTHSFFTAGPAKFMVERSQFEPWYGYWLLVRTTEPVTVTVPVAP